MAVSAGDLPPASRSFFLVILVRRGAISGTFPPRTSRVIKGHKAREGATRIPENPPAQDETEIQMMLSRGWVSIWLGLALACAIPAAGGTDEDVAQAKVYLKDHLRDLNARYPYADW